MAKSFVTEEFSSKIAKGDIGVENDVREFTGLRDDLVVAYDSDCSQVTGDAKIFKEQVD